MRRELTMEELLYTDNTSGIVDIPSTTTLLRIFFSSNVSFGAVLLQMICNIFFTRFFALRNHSWSIGKRDLTLAISLVKMLG